MRLGIMQPYFFPHLGYFELICRTNQWVVFDTPQYARKSWMNRNRILHPHGGWQYINAPVAHAPLRTPIKDIQLVDPEGARRRLLGQINHYRRHAPHFRKVVRLIDDGFKRTVQPSLVALNVATLSAVCDYLEIPFRWSLASELDLPQALEPGQWALHIATQLGASDYLNPPGGRALFRVEDWHAAGVRLRFTRLSDFAYACTPYDFAERLSILDVLMWCSAEEVRAAIANNPLDE